MIRQIVIAAALAFTPAALAAQAPAPDAATLSKAREVLTVMHADDLTRKTLASQMQAMVGGFSQRLIASGEFPPEMAKDPEFQAIMQHFIERLMNAVTASFNAKMPELLDKMAGIYARNFTVAEMNDMIAFYRTPTGQAMLEKMPAVSAEGATVGRDLAMAPAMQAAKDALPQLMTELKAWADKHPQAAGAKKQ